MTNWLNEHRVPLVLRVVSDTDLCTRSISERIASLFFVEQLGRFQVDAVQCVKIKNDLIAAPVRLGVDDLAIGDPPVNEEVLPAFGEMVTLFTALEQSKKAHRLIHH